MKAVTSTLCPSGLFWRTNLWSKKAILYYRVIILKYPKWMTALQSSWTIMKIWARCVLPVRQPPQARITIGQDIKQPRERTQYIWILLKTVPGDIGDLERMSPRHRYRKPNSGERWGGQCRHAKWGYGIFGNRKMTNIERKTDCIYLGKPDTPVV